MTSIRDILKMCYEARPRPFRKFSRWCSAMSALADMASTVSKPTCGRSTVFGAVKIGCLAGNGGSASNTSMPATQRTS
jgi:hypothetical protein